MWGSMIIIILVLPASHSTVITDTCMHFQGSIVKDLTRENQKGAFDCSITLPCQQDLVSVSMIEIVQSDDSKTRNVAILRNGTTVEGWEKSDAAGSLDKSGTSDLSVKFAVDNINSETIYMDCIVRGLTRLKEPIVLSKSLRFKTSTCKKEHLNRAFYCERVFTYNGTEYCLSINVVISDLAAINFCNSVGGYLAEIEDKNEYLAIQAEVRKADVETVMIGGTDQAYEGFWIYQHSQRPVKFFDWAINQPDNDKDADCLDLIQSSNYKMSDIPCNDPTKKEYHCLCELNK